MFKTQKRLQDMEDYLELRDYCKGFVDAVVETMVEIISIS